MQTVVSVAFLLVTPLPTLAQDANTGAAEIADRIGQCRAITTAAERLACFDTAAAAFVEAREAKQIVIVDRADVREAKRSIFGFSLPRIRLFGSSGDDEPEVREIESTLASVRSIAGGHWLMSLADKSVWQTTEGSMLLIPHKDQPIKIEAGLLGSYRAKINGGRSVRVKRIQ